MRQEHQVLEPGNEYEEWIRQALFAGKLTNLSEIKLTLPPSLNHSSHNPTLLPGTISQLNSLYSASDLIFTYQSQIN